MTVPKLQTLVCRPPYHSKVRRIIYGLDIKRLWTNDFFCIIIGKNRSLKAVRNRVFVDDGGAKVPFLTQQGRVG